MTKITDFIKTYPIWIISLLIFLLVFFTAINKSSEKKIVQNTQTANVAVLRAFLIDSIQSVSLNEKIEISKALAASEASYSVLLKKKGIYLKIKSDSSEHIARSDSSFTVKCDSALRDKSSLIWAQGIIIKSDSVQLNECSNHVILLDSLNTSARKNLNVYLQLNTNLQKDVKRTFIEQNGIAIGAAGLGIIIFISKFIL